MPATAAIRLIVHLWHDDCPQDPCEDDWSIYSFNRRHHNRKDPESIGFEYDDDGRLVPDPDLRAKLDAGLAFPLSYYEHGGCIWSLAGELPPGADCPWDSVGFAGLMVWEQPEENMGAKTPEDRREDARRMLERYTYWCNGEVYGYHIRAVKTCCECGSTIEADPDDIDLDLPSCGGYYPDDIDGMVIDMKDHIGDDWRSYPVSFEEQHPYGLAEECEKRWKDNDDSA